jgi:hypothetical protein
VDCQLERSEHAAGFLPFLYWQVLMILTIEEVSSISSDRRTDQGIGRSKAIICRSETKLGAQALKRMAEFSSESTLCRWAPETTLASVFTSMTPISSLDQQ